MSGPWCCLCFEPLSETHSRLRLYDVCWPCLWIEEFVGMFRQIPRVRELWHLS